MFFSSVSLVWEVLNTALSRAIVWWEVKPVVRITSAERFVPTVRTTLNVAVANSVAITNANIHVD